MDGTARMAIHTGLVSLISIALDLSSQTLYWIDARGYIESSDTNGYQRRVLTVSGSANGIDFFNGNLYFTSSRIESVSIVRPNSTLTSYGFETCASLWNIKVISADRQIPSG